jgi:hypothetical protein
MDPIQTMFSQPTGDTVNDDGNRLVTINPQHMRDIMSVVMVNPYVRGALDTIATHLLSDGFRFSHRNRRMRQTYQQTLTSHFSDMTRRLIHDWFAVGIAFVCIQPDHELIFVAQVLPIQECTIQFETCGMKRKYTIHHPLVNQTNQRVYVLERFKPLSNGTLTSPACNLLFHMGMNQQLWVYHMQTTKLRCRSILGFQRHENRQTAPTDASGPRLGSHDNFRQLMNQPINRMNLDPSQLQTQNQMFQEKCRQTHRAIQQEDETFTSIEAVNHHHTQVLQAPQPVDHLAQSGRDILHMVSLLTGVPLIYMGGSQHHRLGSEPVELYKQKMEQTLDDWSVHLQNVMSNVLHGMYSKLDQYREFKSHWLRTQLLPSSGLQHVRGRQSVSLQTRQLYRTAQKSHQRLLQETQSTPDAINTPNTVVVTVQPTNQTQLPPGTSVPTIDGVVPPSQDLLLGSEIKSQGDQVLTGTAITTDQDDQCATKSPSHSHTESDSEDLMEHGFESMSESDDSEDEPLLTIYGTDSNMEIMFGRTFLRLQALPPNDNHPEDRFASALIDMLDDDIKNTPDREKRLHSLMLRRHMEIRQASKTQLRRVERKHRQLRRLGMDNSCQTKATRQRALRQFKHKKKRLHRAYQTVKRSGQLSPHPVQQTPPSNTDNGDPPP